MQWIEKHNRKEKQFYYICDDFFGSIELTTNVRLSPALLDRIQLSVSSGSSGENDLEIKNGNNIIKLHYKFIKNNKSSWEKLLPEEL